jgi:hypothetical protein
MTTYPLASFRAGFIMIHDLNGSSRHTMPAVSDAKMFMQAISVLRWPVFLTIYLPLLLSIPANAFES